MTMRYDISKLIQQIRSGDSQALSKLISFVENNSEYTPKIIKGIYPYLGKSFRLGITGPLGAGKSTLIDKLMSLMRNDGLSIGAICVDPSSPFTGGAVLGDRIRMTQHYLDPAIFIRSMATRDSIGGLPKAVGNVVKLMDAFCKDVTLIETVGIGQTQYDILQHADTVVVVLVPEAGDAVQTMKAGLMEIADIFVVNKADRPGAEDMVSSLFASFVAKDDTKQILTTVAVNEVGIKELYEQINQHHLASIQNGKFEERRRKQRRQEFISIINETVINRLLNLMEKDARLTKQLSMIDNGKIDPYTCAEIVLRGDFIKNWATHL